jgi:putative flavoprotein involved in K+ transport
MGSLSSAHVEVKQEGLWFHGGNMHQSRHYSQCLSLHLKERTSGIATFMYGIPDTHLLS